MCIVKNKTILFYQYFLIVLFIFPLQLFLNMDKEIAEGLLFYYLILLTLPLENEQSKQNKMPINQHQCVPATTPILMES